MGDWFRDLTFKRGQRLHGRDRGVRRAEQLRAWADQLAADLHAIHVRPFPTETYFLLADFAPHDASVLAERLRQQNILVKPLADPALGPGFIRITTALPQENERFIESLKAMLSSP